MKLSTITTLTITIMLLVGLDYLNAAWTEPAQTPTAGNIPTPINVGAVDQAKVGGLATGNLSVNGTVAELDTTVFDYWFTNTGANQRTMWRLRRNDGTGNFSTYINTEGGAAPTLFTEGFAFREHFSPGPFMNGEYEFFTSNSGPAGTPITWTKALGIGNGAINVNRICDGNGQNCTNINDIISSTSSTSTIPNNNFGNSEGLMQMMYNTPPPPGLNAWPDWLFCEKPYYFETERSYKDTQVNNARRVSFDGNGYRNNSASCGTIQQICMDGRCGFYDGSRPAVLDPNIICNAYGCS